MSASFMVPPVGFGPGSQLGQEDEELNYLAMPSGVNVYEPHVPEIEDPAIMAATLAFLENLQKQAQDWQEGDARLLPRHDLAPASAAAVNDALGEGEVSARLEDTAGLVEVQETVFAGVWSLRAYGGPHGQDVREQVEVSAFPKALVARAFPAKRNRPDVAAGVKDGVVNAPAILTELFEQSENWRPQNPPHVVNLSLLPHTPEDMDMLETCLGRGRLTILSRGYGNCRIEATATPHIWRVRYFNSMDTLILDTIEVSTVPEVACAAPEDIADSASRLHEICTVLREEGASRQSGQA
ncbi:hydrogenase expression/formation protein [Acetobacter sp. LMG 32666]|uniref:hydrogenase expression/formation protein n=1 Tax=Acetobacter sp. LMG 32666 TaxID=2959295 RepID=UPI0030C82EFA